MAYYMTAGKRICRRGNVRRIREDEDMGMRIGGSSSGRQVISVKDAGGSVKATISVSKPGIKRKKPLRYNFKEISMQIMMAKTSGNARSVAAKARRKTGMLQRKRKNEDYDEQELELAIAHAKKLERIAKKRMKHLEAEEKAQQTGSCLVETEDYEGLTAQEQGETEEAEEAQRKELERLMREYRAMMEESMEELGESVEEAGIDGLKEMADELLGGVQEDMDPEDLERLKKKHRSEELRELMEADMKYLRDLFGKLAREKQENSGGSGGVSLQLGGTEMPVPAPEEVAAPAGGSVDVMV